MKNNFDRTKTATARFSTRAVAMVLFFVMLLTAIGSGSVLSAIAADFDAISGDAIPAAATEGSDIALNAIPSEGAAVDNAVTKPDLSGFEENEIVRGIKKDFAETGANVDLSQTSDTTYYLVGGTFHGNSVGWTSTSYPMTKVGSYYYRLVELYKNDWFAMYDGSNQIGGTSSGQKIDPDAKSSDWKSTTNSTNAFQFNGDNGTYKIWYDPTGNKCWATSGFRISGSTQALGNWGDGADIDTPYDAEVGTYYKTLTLNNGDTFKIRNYNGDWFGGSNNPHEFSGSAIQFTGSNNFKFTGTSGTYDLHVNPNSKYIWLTAPAGYYLHYSSTDSGMQSTTGQLMSDSSNTWTYTISDYNSDAIYFNITTSSSATTNTTSVTGTPTCSDGVDAPTSGENGQYKYFRSGLQSKPQNLTFTFNSSTGVLTVKGSMVNVQLTAGTSSDYQLRATDGSTMITNYGQTKTANYLTGKTVTITVTPQDSTKYVTGISCTGSGNSPSAVTDNGNGTYSATMTVKAAGTITAALAAKPTYTVSFSSSDASKGTVAARTSDGTILSSGDRVVKGTKVTFIATPVGNNAFAQWSGTFTSSTSTKTYTVNSDVTETATFGTKGYKVIAGNDNGVAMTELSNGTYISRNTYNDGAYFRIVRNADDFKTVGSNSSGQQEIKDTDKHDVTSWTSGATWSNNGAFISKTGSAKYVVYDPATDKIWLTADKDDLYGVTVIAKDGTIRYGYKTYNTDYTSAFGDTTVELVTPTSITGTVDNNAYDGQAVAYNLTADDVREGVTLKIKTVVKDAYKDKYYVKGFSVSGTEETYSVLWQEFNDDKTEKASYADRDKIHGKSGVENGRPWNEFTLTISDYPEKGIEITPIYFIKENKSGDNVRFYVEGFAGEAYDDWGGTLAIDAYNTSGARLFGEYPGQPMVNYNGRYFVDLPTTGVTGVTMNNYVWDRIHSNLFYGTSGKATGHEDTVKAVNYQTYDFNDFTYLKQSDAVKNHDEDIVFSFRYRKDSNYNTKATSQLGQSTYYINSTGVYGNDGWTSGEALDNNDYRKNFNVLDPDSPIYEWENFTDFYGNRVDIFGDYVDTKDSSGAATNPKAAYTNPIRIVSNGYDYDEAGHYATAWALYEPVDANGNSAYTGTYDHYQLFEVFGGQGLSNYGSSSYLVNPNWTENLRWKYDKAYCNAHSSETPKADFVYDLADVPTVISYEYQVKDGFSNLNLEGESGDGDPGYRSDGRWFVTSSDQLLKAHAVVEVAESQNSEFVRDYFQSGGIDYTSSTGYDPAENTGIDTGIKAYFTNDDSGSAGTTTYTNTSGHTEAFAVSDGDHTFDLTTVPDSTGNYMFVGWYMYTNGKYSWLSNDLSYESEATANDVYVARYVKIPSGSLTITHNLTSNSTGSATCEAKVEVLNNGTPIDTQPYQEFTDGVIRVTSKYIKDNSDYTLRITLKNTPEENSIFDNFYNELEGTNVLSNSISTFVNNVTTSGTTAVITTNAIKTLFTDGVQQIKSLPFFSKVDEQLILTHDLLPEKDDSVAETYVKYQIMSSGETTTYFTSDEVKNGPLTVAPEHLYKNTDRRMVVTLRTKIAQNKFHDFDRFSMKLPDGTYYLFKEGKAGLNGENVHIEENEDHTQATITISFPINKLLSNGKLQMNQLQYFSELKTPRFKYSIEYRYDSYVKSYGTQSYTVSGYFDELPSELANYTDYSTYYNQQLTFKADATSTSYLKTLASSMAPYEDNFRKTFDFSKASIFYQQYNRGAETYEYKVKASADNQSLIATMKFPYKVGEYGVPLNSNGQIASSSDIIYAAPASDLDKTDVTDKEFRVYSGDWIVKSGSRNEKIENYEEPTFIRPALIYQDANGTKHYFQFWSVKTIGSYGASSLEYTRCYDTSFNFTIFQECEIEPVYSTVAWDMPNPPSTWDMYERFDPEVNRTADNQNGITIRFMENSRNQYNHNGYGSFYNESNVETSKTTEVAERRRGAADRVYTDFLISYNNVEPNTILKEKYKDGGKKVGIVIQPVGKVSETGGATKTEAQYMSDYGDTVTDEMKSAVSNYLQGKGGQFAKAEFDAKELDNKNRIRYYFGIDNKTAKALNTTTLPELDETYSNSHDMIYRAYAYIVDYDETNHTYNWSTLKMNDVPTYYTIYDIGSIQNGGSYPSGN